MNETSTNNDTSDQSRAPTPTGPPGGEKMRAINVMVLASVYLHARVASAQSGLPLKTWVAIVVSNAEAVQPGARI